MNAEEIYNVHEKIGFPPLSEKEQADILLWHDVAIINRLTPDFKADYIPPAVVKRYVTLSKDSFRTFFATSGYIEKLYENHLNYPQQDSHWVEKAKKRSGYEFKVQERGGLVHLEFFEDYEKVIDYFVDWIYKTLTRL